MDSYQAMAELVGRAMRALLFLFQGITAIPRFSYNYDKLRRCHVPAANFALACGLTMMLVGASMMMFGVFPALGAGLLIVFTLVATVLFLEFLDAQRSRPPTREA